MAKVSKADRLIRELLKRRNNQGIPKRKMTASKLSAVLKAKTKAKIDG